MCLKILQATKGMSTCSHVDRERWQREAALIHGGQRLGDAARPCMEPSEAVPRSIYSPNRLSITNKLCWGLREQKGERRTEKAERGGGRELSLFTFWLWLSFGFTLWLCFCCYLSFVVVVVAVVEHWEMLQNECEIETQSKWRQQLNPLGQHCFPLFFSSSRHHLPFFSFFLLFAWFTIIVIDSRENNNNKNNKSSNEDKHKVEKVLKSSSCRCASANTSQDGTGCSPWRVGINRSKWLSVLKGRA